MLELKFLVCENLAAFLPVFIIWKVFLAVLLRNFIHHKSLDVHHAHRLGKRGNGQRGEVIIDILLYVLDALFDDVQEMILFFQL